MHPLRPSRLQLLLSGAGDDGYPGLGFDIGDAGAEAIQSGFLETWDAAQQLSVIDFEKMVVHVEEAIPSCSNYRMGLERISIDFIQKVLRASV